MAMSCCCPATIPPCIIRSSMPPPGVPLLPGAVSVASPARRGRTSPERDAYGDHSPPESIDYPRCACNGDVCWAAGGGGVLPGHQIKPQDSIRICIRVVINKFCPNKTVVDAADPHRFPNVSFLLVIEGESDREHIVDHDGMSTQDAEPDTRP